MAQINNNNDNYDWLWCIPQGWEEIGRQMITECEAINPTYTIEDLKEKYGSMRVFSYCQSWYNNELIETNHNDSHIIDEIENKYEKLSEHTCCNCGAPATKISTGWILPWCDSCGQDEEKYYKRLDNSNDD